MIVSNAFRGKRFAVLGLARSGMAAARTLLASGAAVTVWDLQEDLRQSLAGQAEIADPLEIALTGFDGVVVSPGVPLNRHPIAAHAARFGVPVIGDIELFALARSDLPPHKVVGITGTNGKSTTTALIHHILQEAGVPARMAGNIGKPILAEDPLMPNERGVGVYVLELSSFQLDLTRSLDCDVAVLLNITPDHLDRYDSFESYAASKNRLLDMQSADHKSVINLSALDAGLIRPNPTGYRGISPATALEQQNWPALKGPHNAENAGAARTACEWLGLTDAQIEQGMRSFDGLPHRMELVAEAGGVLFVNDSKATNPASTAPALAAFPPAPGKRVHWIVGGLPKGEGLEECEPYFANVATAYTIGEAGPDFATLLAPAMQVQRCELLCAAVQKAISAAVSGDVVLFSPACASFDQFRDFEARGNAFKQIVDALTSPGSSSHEAGACGA